MRIPRNTCALAQTRHPLLTEQWHTTGAQLEFVNEQHQLGIMRFPHENVVSPVLMLYLICLRTLI